MYFLPLPSLVDNEFLLHSSLTTLHRNEYIQQLNTCGLVILFGFSVHIDTWVMSVSSLAHVSLDLTEGIAKVCAAFWLLKICSIVQANIIF